MSASDLGDVPQAGSPWLNFSPCCGSISRSGCEERTRRGELAWRPAIALDYPWRLLISGHVGRVATREDVARAHLGAVTEHAAAPSSRKYTGVLGGADIEIFTWTTTFAIMQSIRLDRGPSGPVHP